MKTFKLFVFCTLVSSVCRANVDASSLKLKIYKVAFSTSDRCTSATTVYEKSDSEASYQDFLISPKITENATLANGDYKCVIIEFSDILKVTPSSATGSCGITEYDQDVCYDYGGGSPTSTLINGTTSTCSATKGTADRVAMYISTASTSTTGTGGHSAWTPPTSSADANNGFNLGASFVKSGATTGKFVVNADGKVDGSGGSCDMQPPLFSFAKK